MILASIAISAAYQSHGPSSALVGWAIAKACAGTVSRWAHTLEAGSTIFQKLDCQEVGKLKVP